MGLILSAKEAQALFAEAADRGVALPAFGTENRDTTEALFRAAAEIGEEFGLRNPPLVIGFTAAYPGRSNLLHYTSRRDMMEGLLALKEDILRLSRTPGPYEHLRVLVHLDHAQPEGDKEVIEACAGWVGSIMYDCSALPLAENRRRVADFVRQRGEEFLVEGAVDEIPAFEEAWAESDLTAPEEAERFVKETGVALIVVNVGTEHRAALAGRVRYDGERARQIASRVGPILCLHGTSSLSDEELEVLKEDGFVKVNVWTALERESGQALARSTLEDLGWILPEGEIARLEAEGIITRAFRQKQAGRRPSLDHFTHTHRRDQVWLPVVVEAAKKYFRGFGYRRLRDK